MSNYTNSVTEFPDGTDKHQRPVRYNIACGTATTDNASRLYRTMSPKNRDCIDRYDSNISQPIDLAATGQDRSVSQRARGLLYGAYVEESRRQGDAEPITHLDPGRERWCSLNMSYVERKKLATFVDPRFQSTWYRLGEGQMELDQTAMERYRLMKEVSNQLGGSDTLSHSEYSILVQSQIDKGDVESQWLFTPSGLREQQEEDVTASLKRTDHMTMENLRRKAKTACDIAKDLEISAADACHQFRNIEDARAASLREEYHRMVLELKLEIQEQEEEAKRPFALSHSAISLNNSTAPGHVRSSLTLPDDESSEVTLTSVDERPSLPYGLTYPDERRPSSSTSFVSWSRVRAFFAGHRN